MARQFLVWRDFGFAELRRGRLALWNPHAFSGTPFFGAFESALLYPPNWLHLLLPLDLAVNAVVLLHVFLAGLFTLLWARRRGASAAAGAAAGAAFMFSGPVFLRVFAGHLPVLCSAAWAPAIYCAVEGFAAEGSAGWLLAGTTAVALQVLAGNPQVLYYTALFAPILALRAKRRGRAAAGVAAMYAGAAALSAVQLMTGLQAAAESIRSGPMPYGFAASFSLPPENLLTLLSPQPLGGIYGLPYFGRWYYWETTLFMGVTALFLAANSRNRSLLAMAAAALVLAMGDHTPLFRVLYHCLPGYDRFRGAAKFGFLSALFLSLAAAEGLDRLRSRRGAAWSAAGVGLLAALAAWGPTAGPLASLGASRAMHAPEPLYHDPRFLQQAPQAAARGLAWRAAVLLSAAALARPGRGFLHGTAALAILESAAFARANLATMSPEEPYPAAWAAALDGLGAARVLHDPEDYANSAMKRGVDDVWGYGSFVLRRYARLMAAGQGVDPDVATQYLVFKGYSPVLSLVRCRYSFLDNEAKTIVPLPRPMPRLSLVDGWALAKSPDEALHSVLDPAFDPRKTAILESEPSPTPGHGAGRVGLVAALPGSLEIRADLAEPSILLITDAYSAGWRAKALAPSAQARYEVLPADYALRAVPLAAGRHHLLVYYAPSSYLIGRWISAAALLAFLVACGSLLRRK